jgi:aminoacyl-tRNA hydrolase
MFPVSIRYGIPLLIIVFTAVLAAYTVQKEWRAAEAFVRGEAVSDMLDRMALLQKQFSYAFAKGEHERIAQEMSFLSSGPEPWIAMLANDAAVVISATNGEWVGRLLTEVARAQWPGWSGEPLEAIIDRVRAQFAGELYLAAAGRYVLGIYPVMLDAGAGSLPAERVGVLLVQRDISRQLAHARRTVGKHWVEMTGVLAGLAIILGILIHLLVTRRLNTLLNVTQRFAAGNLEARSTLRGTDEVAILGRAFDHMAEQVADTQRQLEHRVQQRTVELGETVSELQKEIAERRRAEETLFDEKERIRVTLASIGDAVITTDVAGRVDYLNPSAERLTGWSKDEAAGQLLGQVFNIIDESSRDLVEDPMQQGFQDDQIVGLANNMLLICRDGQERSIDYSASPIHDHQGTTVGTVLVFRDVTEARRAARQLSYHASHDALTGLINRREFERRLERILATSAPEESHAVVYLDLDQFKIVNDTCGHVAGDALLHQIGGIFATQVRKRDTVARLGGDEFAVLLEHCQQEQVLRIAHKVCEVLQDFRFVWQDRGFTIGASIGLVLIEPGVDALASIFRAADTACYAAKEQGRNRVHVYKRDGRELAQRHEEMQWVLHMQEAFAFSDFEKDEEQEAWYVDGDIDDAEVTLVLPDTYMNRSGIAVSDLIEDPVEAQQLSVIYDDIDLPLGTMKISFGRGTGGHKGVESIIRAVGTRRFIRIRIGISPAVRGGGVKKPKGDEKVSAFVLGAFRRAEQPVIEDVYERVADAAAAIVTQGYEYAMNQYN